MSFWSNVGNMLVTGVNEVKQRDSDYTREYSECSDDELFRVLAKIAKSKTSFIKMNVLLNILKGRGYTMEEIKENVKIYM